MADDVELGRRVGEAETLYLLAGKLPAVLWSTDCQLRVTAAFGAGLAVVGLRPEPVAGMALSEFFQTDDPNCPAITAHRRALRGESDSFEHCWADRTYCGHIEPLRDATGKVIGSAGVAQDVTEYKRAEERLRAELAHLARVQTMGEMASGMAHELSQPLSAIVMQAEVAGRKLQLEGEDAKQELLEMLKFVADEAYRTGEIIRRVREFVKKAGPRRTTVDLSEVIEEVLVLVHRDLRHAGIALRVDVDRPLPTTLADKIQVQQVLVNLIRNAIEAMQRVGSTAHELTIQVRACDGAVQTTVRDTGCGVPEQHLEQLFGAFYSTKPGGMGMGLAISRSIVEAHGGRIWAKRNADRGSAFTFTLPIVREESTNDRGNPT